MSQRSAAILLNEYERMNRFVIGVPCSGDPMGLPDYAYTRNDQEKDEEVPVNNSSHNQMLGLPQYDW